MQSGTLPQLQENCVDCRVKCLDCRLQQFGCFPVVMRLVLTVDLGMLMKVQLSAVLLDTTDNC